jgi:hypothetical protein
MDQSLHQEVSLLISRLMRGENVSDNNIEKAADHISSCRQCLGELALAVKMATDIPPAAGKWLKPEIICRLCRDLLPQYVEMEENSACSKFPWASSHLQSCAECKKEEEILRCLVGFQEEIGPPPLPNSIIIRPTEAREPVVIRFLQKVRLFWENKKSMVDQVKETPFIIGAEALFSSFESSASAPAYLGPDEFDVQNLSYKLSGGLDLDIVVANANNFFELTVIPSLKTLSGKVYINLCRIESQDADIIACEEGKDHQSFLFSGLEGGLYEVHVEAVIDDVEHRWEVPFELA